MTRAAFVRVLEARRQALAETAMLKRFVLDWCDGQIFSNLHMASDDLLPAVFMVLMFMKRGDIPEDATIVYEHMSQAQQRSINGYPTFYSARFLTRAQWQRVWPAIQKEEARRKELAV